MIEQKLLNKFHQGKTLFFLKEELRENEPYTIKISIWKTSFGAKILMEEFFDKYYEANDLYAKDETKEFKSLDEAINALNTLYNITLGDFK